MCKRVIKTRVQNALSKHVIKTRYVVRDTPLKQKKNIGESRRRKTFSRRKNRKRKKADKREQNKKAGKTFRAMCTQNPAL